MREELRKLSPSDGRDVYALLQSMPEENGFQNDAYGLNPDGFAAWLELHDAQSRGERLSEGYVPQTSFWYCVDGEPVGMVKLRHFLTDHLRVEGGHIGYALTKASRGKGYASRMLNLALREAAKLGIERALVTANLHNTPSRRAIERCGGVLQDTEGGIARYWLETGVEIRRGVPLSAHTTFRVGGKAEFFAEADSPARLSHLLAWAEQRGLPVLLLGNGSNLLVRDGGFRGLAIRYTASKIDMQEDGLVHAEAGASLSSVAQFAREHGLSGLEPLSGIPGTVGGAALMNAGAYGGEMAQVVRAVDTLEGRLEGDALAYGYRKSAMQARNLIITGALFALSKDDPKAIDARMAEYAQRRREKQPLTQPSAGSFFKRPQNGFAGALIEAAGMKGASVGGAQVSPLHAGFIVNTGSASARDVLDLMARVQARVREHSGVSLEPEVRIVGEDG